MSAFQMNGGSFSWCPAGCIPSHVDCNSYNAKQPCSKTIEQVLLVRKPSSWAATPISAGKLWVLALQCAMALSSVGSESLCVLTGTRSYFYDFVHVSIESIFQFWAELRSKLQSLFIELKELLYFKDEIPKWSDIALYLVLFAKTCVKQVCREK